jgi:hypothetical protein
MRYMEMKLKMTTKESWKLRESQEKKQRKRWKD